MTSVDSWPEPVAAYLRRTFGPPRAVEPLGGMSSAVVSRVRFHRGSVVVKSGPSGRETLVYTHLGTDLQRAGVPLPHLLWSTHVTDQHWLVLEDIPTPAPITPRIDWRPDARMVAPLARLHRLPLDAPVSLTTLDEPTWSDESTEVAVSFFAAGVGRTLRAPLRALQEEGQHVLAPWCWIHGDPNPTNWGIREDGTPALYDWERFRRGTPAIDLAILITGMGDADAYAALAHCYLSAWRTMTDRPPWRATTLTRDITLAKVWVTVSFLGMCMRNEGAVPDRLRGQLLEFVPPWLHAVAAHG